MKHHLPVELKDRLNPLRSRLATIFGVFGLVFVIGLFSVIIWPQYYKGRVNILISPHETAEPLNHLSTFRFGTRKFISEQVSLIRSKKFLTKFAGQNKLGQLWDTSHSRAYSKLRKRISVNAISNDTIELTFSSKDPEEALEIANLIGKAFLSHWRNLHEDQFKEMNKALEIEHKKFKSTVAIKIAAYEALAKEPNVDRNEIETAKQELSRLKVRNTTYTNQISQLKLEKAIIASAARFTNQSDSINLEKGVNWKAGLGLTSLIAMFCSLITAAYLCRKRAPKKQTSVADIADAVASNQLTLVPRNREKFALAKPFESLRESVLNEFPNPEGVVLSLVPCVIGEDAATVSSQLAKSLAAVGYPTLLVDGNLKNSRLHEFFEASSHPGLTDFLSGEMTLQETVVKTRESNLWIMPGGTAKDDTVELLQSESRKNLLEEARSRFDIVILNNAPILSGIDSLILIGDSDLAFVCTEREHATTDLMSRTRNAIIECGGKFGGLVLTRVESKEFDTALEQFSKSSD